MVIDLPWIWWSLDVADAMNCDGVLLLSVGDAVAAVSGGLYWVMLLFYGGFLGDW